MGEYKKTLIEGLSLQNLARSIGLCLNAWTKATQIEYRDALASYQDS